jgi:hypothetical protein
MISSPLPMEEDWTADQIIESVFAYLKSFLQHFASLLSEKSIDVANPTGLHSTPQEIIYDIKELLTLRYLEEMDCPFPFADSLLKDGDEDQKESQNAENDNIFRFLKGDKYAEKLARKVFRYYFNDNSANGQLLHDLLHSDLIQQSETLAFKNDCSFTGGTVGVANVGGGGGGGDVCDLFSSTAYRAVLSEELRQKNERMIFFVKVADYIEEVFLFISRMLINGKKVLPTSDQLLLNEVPFLCSFVSSILSFSSYFLFFFCSFSIAYRLVYYMNG